jgi:hypothetical protein
MFSRVCGLQKQLCPLARAQSYQIGAAEFRPKPEPLLVRFLKGDYFFFEAFFLPFFFALAM